MHNVKPRNNAATRHSMEKATPAPCKSPQKSLLFCSNVSHSAKGQIPHPKYTKIDSINTHLTLDRTSGCCRAAPAFMMQFRSTEISRIAQSLTHLQDRAGHPGRPDRAVGTLDLLPPGDDLGCDTAGCIAHTNSTRLSITRGEQNTVYSIQKY